RRQGTRGTGRVPGARRDPSLVMRCFSLRRAAIGAAGLRAVAYSYALRRAAIRGAVLGTLACSWALRRALEYNLARVRAGDPGPLLRFYAEDVRFRFPGDSSWAAEISSKRELERWIARFMEVGLELYPEQVVIAGPPWNTTFCIRC